MISNFLLSRLLSLSLLFSSPPVIINIAVTLDFLSPEENGWEYGMKSCCRPSGLTLFSSDPLFTHQKFRTELPFSYEASFYLPLVLLLQQHYVSYDPEVYFNCCVIQNVVMMIMKEKN